MSVHMSSSYKSRSPSPFALNNSQTLKDSLQFKERLNELAHIGPLAEIKLSKALDFDLQERLFMKSSIASASEQDVNFASSK